MKVIKKFLLFFIITIIYISSSIFTQPITQIEYNRPFAEVENNIYSMNEEEFSIYLNNLFNPIDQTIPTSHIPPQAISNEQTEYNRTFAEIEKNIYSMNEEEFSVYLNNIFNPTEQPSISAPSYIPQPIADDISEEFIDDLKNFDYKSASILPIFTIRKEKYVILGREAFGRPKIGKKGTYDDFGGTRDEEENNPLVTAAREFFEEAILDKSLNLTLEEVLDYIKNNIHMVIANTTKRRKKHVTYIIDFKYYKNDFIQNFYKALNSATQHENLEKNKIAIVRWNAIKEALIEQENNNPVYVSATIINPITNKSYKNQIKLRPYFIVKLKNFFLDKPYKTKNNKKIRFYT